MPKINSLEVVHQDTNKDSYQNLHDILVELNKSLAVSKEVVDGTARASIENLLEMYVNDKEAFLRSVQTLTATFKNSEAQFSQEILLKASEIEALAKKTSTLSASVSNNTASIESEQYARATADSALAYTIDTVSARLDTGDFATVKIQSEAGAFKASSYKESVEPIGTSEKPLVDGDIWFDTSDSNKTYRYTTSSVTKTVSSVSTTTETITTTSAHTFQTGAEVTFSTTGTAIGGLVSGGTYYIIRASSTTFKVATTYSNAVAGTAINLTSSGTGTRTFSGIGGTWAETTDTRIGTTYARWGVEVDANGNVAGLQLNSDSSGTSEFTVVADNFKVWGSGGAQSTQKPLDISVSGSTQTMYLGNVMQLYYEGTTLNRWAAISNVKCSGIYARPTASDITALPYSWASNGSAGYFAGNTATDGDYHGIRGAVFTSNNPASIASRGIVGSHTGDAFYAEVGSYAPFTGSHQCVVTKNTDIEVGQIVVDVKPVIKKDISNTLCEVTLSSTANQKGTIGVFVSNTGPMSQVDTIAAIFEHRIDDGFGNLTGPLTEQYDAVKDQYDVVSVNALGEGQVLVCGENGSISKGDLIVTSSTAGIGMRQTDDVIRSYTVAKAREDITFDDTTTPKLIACIYLCG